MDMERYSFWEEMDRDWDRWKAILKPDQFKVWMGEHKKQIKQHEKELIEKNKSDEKEVRFYQAYLGWLKKTFLPGLHKTAWIETIYVRIREKDKVNFLRGEFQTYRQRLMNNAIIRHYRYSRLFQPNTLQLLALRHEEGILIPNYPAFIEQADEGIKAVGKLFLERNKPFFSRNVHIVDQFKTIREYHKVLREKFFGDETREGGWHVVIDRKTDVTPGEEAWMSYLLMDTMPVTATDYYQLGTKGTSRKKK
jgi:hypothetical protein